MKDILLEITKNKRIQVEQDKNDRPLEGLIEKCRMAKPQRSAKTALSTSFSGIIAEFKRRSPSKGWIHPEARVQDVVVGYEKAGASVCSILTDSDYFGGTKEDLITARSLTNLPLLRKDFIIDPYQIYEAKALGADVILLIAACLSVQECEHLSQTAHLLGLEILLEVHAPEELDHLNAYVDMLGVNNRNLGTFHTDVALSFKMAERMKKQSLKMENRPLLVSESGLSDPKVVCELKAAGFDGFLMGEAFMKEADPADALAKFIHRLS